MNLAKAGQKFKQQWDRFFKTAEKPLCCIFCEGTKIYWNGQRERTASVLIGDEVVHLTDILCKRVKCANPECKKSWTLRPSGLMPRRHFQLCVVANATSKFLFDPQATLTLVANAHRCCRRTVGRWLDWIAGIAAPADLIRRLLNVSKDAASNTAFKVSDIVQKAASTAKKIFERTAKNLCILEALGTAYGYEPPSLRGVVEAAISNRDRVTTYHRPFIPELAQ
ncbi:MAG: hypothetical protein KAT27_01860 [Desulfobacterales bacterium]|nr:hypothetical protein [Desulfobacterales bacterium]